VTALAFRGFHLVPPPSEGFWRVTDWHEPFEPRPAPPALGDVEEEDDDSGRWDAPDGSFTNLYCSTQAEGAIAEKLAAFVPHPETVVSIDDFLEGEPDPEFADDYLTAPLDSEDIGSFEWILAHADSITELKFIDVWHWQTCLALAPLVAGVLKAFGLSDLDRRALADERRGFTRRLAGALRNAATEGDGEPVLRAAGLRYESRLPAGWECWALWEPLPIDPESIERTRVEIDTPALRSAAAKLGVPLAESTR
jgi:hypothetical protein